MVVGSLPMCVELVAVVGEAPPPSMDAPAYRDGHERDQHEECPESQPG
jgi:hypothetical protein